MQPANAWIMHAVEPMRVADLVMFVLRYCRVPNLEDSNVCFSTLCGRRQNVKPHTAQVAYTTKRK